MGSDFMDGKLEDVFRPPTADELKRCQDIALQAMGLLRAGAAQDSTGSPERMVNSIAEILGNHKTSIEFADLANNAVSCSCDEQAYWPDGKTWREAHNAHVARKIAEWLAEQK